MNALERRTNRSNNQTAALIMQLEASRKSGHLEAMVIADHDGIPMAVAGDPDVCEEVASRIVLVGRKAAEFSGTLLDGERGWNVKMTRVAVEGGEVLVCAVGGSAEGRSEQVGRSSDGARRILRAA